MIVPRRVAYPLSPVAVGVLVVWLRSQPDRAPVDRFMQVQELRQSLLQAVLKTPIHDQLG